MAEFLHEVIRRREVTTGIDEGWRSVSYTTPIPTDPWAAVEARNADEELHYSGGPF